MLADGLTQLKGSNEALFRMLESGQMKLVGEAEHMETRSSAKQSGQEAHSMRKFGIKENFRSCCHSNVSQGTVDSKPAVVTTAQN